MKRLYFVIATLFLGLTMVCCGGHSHSDHDHAHDHQDNLQLTAYNADFEMYANANPFVVGQPGTVLSHFSYLSAFKPLDSSEVTLSLIVGNDGIRQTLNTATRKGVYKFTLTPTHVGKGKLIYDVKVGDRIEIAMGSRTVAVEVVQVADNVRKDDAGAMYKEI